MDKKGGDLICMRPDNIVEARFSLTRKQNDILDIVFANIQEDDKLEYEIDLHKYGELYNTNAKDRKGIYKKLKKSVESFEGKGFRIKSRELNKTIYYAWFSKIVYLDGECKIRVKLDSELKQLFLAVKRAIYYKIEYTLNFKSVYSKRLYYYLKLYEDTGVRIDKIDELKSKLECPSGYKNFADFNRFVLKPAYREINGNSDITFEYESIKTGKKVTSIKFYIKSDNLIRENNEIKNSDNQINNSDASPVSDENCIAEIEKIFENNITKGEALSILSIINGDLDILRNAYNYCKSKKTDNFIGYIIKIIKLMQEEDFNFPQNNTGKNNNVSGFNNFEPRKYDYDSLEKKLLGWDKDEETKENI